MAQAPPGIAAQAYRSQYTLAFVVSPIILQGGIASSVQGGLLPIIGLYNQLGLFNSFSTPPGQQPGAAPAKPLTVDQFFAQYMPLPGSTLIANSIAMYPFANQQIAANAIIQQPLTISMAMICPVNQPGGYTSKLGILSAIQQSLQAHNIAGGTYIVATPAFVYNNLLMTGMTDITSQRSEGGQQQIEYQLDFIQPLVTLQAAAAAQNSLMTKISGGQQIGGTPAWSGPASGGSQVVSGLAAGVQNFGGQIPSSDPNGPATIGTTGD